MPHRGRLDQSEPWGTGSPAAGVQGTLGASGDPRVFNLPGCTALVCRNLAWSSGWLDAVERLHVDPYPWLLESTLNDPR